MGPTSGRAPYDRGDGVPHRAEEANATQESSTDLVEGRHPDPQASSMAWEGREGDPPFLEPSIPNDFDL